MRSEKQKNNGEGGFGMKRVFVFGCIIVMLALCMGVLAEGNALGTATITSKGVVNVRKEPGKNAKIVGKAKPGLR